MLNQSSRCIVVRSECKSDRHFRECVRKRLQVASPRSIYWIRLKDGQPDALIITTIRIPPYRSHGCTFTPARSWISI